LASPSARRERKISPVAQHGLLMGISKMVVTPPAAAARVSVAKSPRAGYAGARQWKWISTAPGMTYCPRASITSRASSGVPRATLATILPSSSARSSASTARSVITSPLTISVSYIIAKSPRQ
jgi:hypothetical protein